MNTAVSKNKIIIIIPTYSNTEGLKETVSCIRTIGAYPVMVVNNNPDVILADIAELSETTVLTEQTNVGFAKACNDGSAEAIRVFDPDYLVYLNDDVFFTNDWIQECIAEMNTHGWSACAPVLKKPDGTIENVGYRVLIQGRVELETNIKSTRRIDGITAAAMVITRETFELTDGFDETFFAYLEDVDFCLRLKGIHKTFGVAKSAEVVHKGQETSKTMSKKKAQLDYNNWKKIIRRHWTDHEKIRYAIPIFVERMRNLSGVLKAR